MNQKSKNKLCDEIVEYARLSLLIFLQLKSQITKDQLINKLDNSLLDENASEKLKKIIENEEILITEKKRR